MFGFLSVPMGAAYHVVIGLATVLTPLGAGLATAVAIVMFTAGVRLLLSPLSFFAFRGQASLARLQPKIADLRKKYGNQPERLQAELTALYRAEGGGMLAGCLPLLLQLPFFSVMYRLFLSPVVAGQRNGLLTRSLLGTPLGSHLLSGAGLATAHVLVFGGLLALLAAAAYLTAKAARRTQAAVAGSGGSCWRSGGQRRSAAGWHGRARPDTALQHCGDCRLRAARGRPVPADDHVLDAGRAGRHGPAAGTRPARGRVSRRRRASHRSSSQTLRTGQARGLAVRGLGRAGSLRRKEQSHRGLTDPSRSRKLFSI